jgi:hypothetical protein
LLSAAPAHAACVGTTAECRDGLFSAPFAEPTILGTPTTQKCVTAQDGSLACKPAAGHARAAPRRPPDLLQRARGNRERRALDRAEFGVVSANDQTRVLRFDANGVPSWTRPTPVDAGANPGGHDPNTLPGVPVVNGGADGALFCSDVVFLSDGRLLAAGGTDYYLEPGVPLIPYGVSELEGLENARIFDANGDVWTQTGSMNFGRWYPTLVSLPNSKVFVASGVTKLLKPVYPESITQSGRNVVQTETYDPACGTWSENGPLAERTLPLFPRLHMLPNGQVYYNAGGQAFNPFGEGYDQALWNLSAVYDPATQTWSDLAYAGLPLQLNQIGLQQLSAALNPTNSLQAATLLTLLNSLVGTVTSDPTALLNQVGGLLGPHRRPRRAVEKVIGSGMRGSTVLRDAGPEAGRERPVQEGRVPDRGGIPTAVAGDEPRHLPRDRLEPDRQRVDRGRRQGLVGVAPDGSACRRRAGTRAA